MSLRPVDNHRLAECVPDLWPTVLVDRAYRGQAVTPRPAPDHRSVHAELLAHLDRGPPPLASHLDHALTPTMSLQSHAPVHVVHSTTR